MFLWPPNSEPSEGRLMNLRQLRYFIVLAEELHFRRAAERLNITQSPLTLAIQELERELGGRLFHRTQRRVELTEAGAAFRIGAREVLEKMQASFETTRDLLNGESRRVRLGVTAAAALLPFLATTIQRFRIAHPNARLTLHELPSREQLRALQARELDVCVIRMPLTCTPDSGGAIKLLRDRLVVAMHRDHPLTSHAALTVADLKNEPLVIYPKSAAGGIHEIIIQLCAKRSFSPRIVQETRDTGTILALAAARQGIAIVPSELSRIDMPETVFIPLTDDDAATDIYLCFREADSDPRVASLCRIAEAAVAHDRAAAERAASAPALWHRARRTRS
jgi:DNA-binding transcriptional LysR family regulator